MNIEPNAPVDAELLPLGLLADYLHLQADVTGRTRQDEVLALCLRSAIAEIEAGTGRKLLSRAYSLAVPYARQILVPYGAAQGMAVESVYAMPSVSALSQSQMSVSIASNATRIEIASEVIADELKLSFRLGAESWEDIAEDLQLAVIELAALHYARRVDPSIPAEPSSLVRSAIAKNRNLKIFKGLR